MNFQSSTRLISLLTFGLILGAIPPACTLQATNPTPTSPSASSIPSSSVTGIAAEIEPFTTDELFSQSSGGCGMTLWREQDGSRPSGFLFFNGLARTDNDNTALMKVDGEFVRFRRTAATGEERYGQQTSQTFISQDGTIQLQVDVKYGEPGEIESLAVEGNLRIQQNGQTVEIPVRGDAGC